MKNEDRKNVSKLLSLAKARLDKSGFEHEAIWEGFCVSAHSNRKSSGGSWRPDPLANKTDRIRRHDKPCELERKAWRIVRELPDVQFDCLFVWFAIKDQIKPSTQDRYRLGDLLSVLTWKYYTAITIEHGHRFDRGAWNDTCKLAMENLSGKYYKVFPPPKETDKKIACKAVR